MKQTIESNLAALSGRQYSELTGTGTAAIYLALKAARLPKGSFIVLPNILCISPVLAVYWAGHRPVFVDVDQVNINIDLLHLEKLLNTYKIAGVLAVHLFGVSKEINHIEGLCKKHNVFLIEDCAQSFGARIGDRPIGSFGDASIISFGQGKVMDIGHGGAVNTDDASLMNRIDCLAQSLPVYNHTKHKIQYILRRFIYFRIRQLSRWDMKSSRLISLFRIFRGYHLYAFDEAWSDHLQSAIDDHERNLQKRNKIAKKYRDHICNPKIIFSKEKDVLCASPRFTVQIDEAEDIAVRLRHLGISANTLYPPLSSQFRNALPVDNELKNSNRMYGRLLNLWTVDITNEQIDQTISILNNL